MTMQDLAEQFVSEKQKCYHCKKCEINYFVDDCPMCHLQVELEKHQKAYELLQEKYTMLKQDTAYENKRLTDKLGIIARAGINEL